MNAEMIQQEIEKLQRQKAELEVNFHRLGGAIAAYQYMLAQISVANEPNVIDGDPTNSEEFINEQ